MNASRPLRSAIVLAGLLATPALVLGQAQGTAAATTDEVTQERMALPHPVLIKSIGEALGEGKDATLTAEQAKEVRTIHESFDKEIKEFLRRHAGKDAGGGGARGGSDIVPNREEAERRVLAVLNKDQRKRMEKALQDAASKRVSERHSSSHHDSSHHETRSPDGKIVTSTSRESSSKSESSRQSGSSSKSSSDHKSSSSSDKQNKSDTQKSTDKSSSSSDKKSDTPTKVSWSKLDEKQQKTTIVNLLDQLDAKDREILAKELNIAVPAPAAR